jgi:polyhydroxyalkanoate synthase
MAPALVSDAAGTFADATVDSLPIGDVLGRIDPIEVARALVAVVRSGGVRSDAVRVASELIDVARGRSDASPDPRDGRFSDPAWANNPVFRRLMQNHLVLAAAGVRLVDRADVDWQKAARARWGVEAISATLAPSNFPITNPSALKRAFDTGGRSAVRGVHNFLSDVCRNRAMPRSVDRSPFVVGSNLAATPGAVVYREELFELLQYTPTTSFIDSTPLLFIPPEISRHYVLDLAPRRSLAEYAVSQGVSCFAIVWRNPSEKEHGTWGMDEYVAGQLRAIDVVCEIARQDSVNVVGICGGGLSTVAMLGHQAAIGDDRVTGATFMVTMVDATQPHLLGAITTESSRKDLRDRADRNELLRSYQLLRTFAWLRPNDLVFNFIVKNWLLGESPPAFDVLAWNDDCTNATTRFAADATEAMYGEDRLAVPGAWKVLGTPVDLTQVTCDTFHIAGETDHITPWRPCYRTTQLLGGSSDVVITSTGHVQTIVNPPGKARAKYYYGPSSQADPNEWRAGAAEQEGSWWPRWTEWLKQRSGPRRAAPKRLGSRKHPPGVPAPGEYAVS